MSKIKRRSSKTAVTNHLAFTEAQEDIGGLFGTVARDGSWSSPVLLDNDPASEENLKPRLLSTIANREAALSWLKRTQGPAILWAMAWDVCIPSVCALGGVYGLLTDLLT